MINYLFSGLDKEKGFTKEQEKYLKKDIKSNVKIVYICSIPDNYERSDEQLLRYTNMFKNIDIKFSKESVIDKRITKETAKELINEADIIFLMGGSPELQMNFILEYDLVNEIKNKNIVLGVSAGSMNQSKRVMYKDDFDNYKLKDYQGLGLVDINIFPHVDLSEDIMKEGEEINQIIPLILLPNDSFIRVENNNVEIIGNNKNKVRKI